MAGHVLNGMCGCSCWPQIDLYREKKPDKIYGIKLLDRDIGAYFLS